MRFHIFAVLLTSLIVTGTSAQQLLIFGDNALPSCAQQCTSLSQAQAACVPPANPVTNQATYESCFCQSGYLTALKTSPESVCGNVCGTTDELSQIATWYTNNCADGGAAAAAAVSQSASTTSPTSTSTVSSSAAGNSAATSSTDTTSTRTSNSQKEEWWANHWKWVMMIVIVLVGLALIALVAVLIRRRHLRRQDTMKGRFNDGITTRSMATTQDASMGQSGYDLDRRGTPLSLRQTEGRVDSAAKMSRVRERDLDSTIGMRRGIADSSRGGTPVNDLDGNGYRGKGKNRARVEQEEI